MVALSQAFVRKGLASQSGQSHLSLPHPNANPDNFNDADEHGAVKWKVKIIIYLPSKDKQVTNADWHKGQLHSNWNKKFKP